MSSKRETNFFSKCRQKFGGFFSNQLFLTLSTKCEENNRYNLRINLIVLERRTSKEKEVEIPLETEKIELSLS